MWILTYPNDNANANSPKTDNLDRKLMSLAHESTVIIRVGRILSNIRVKAFCVIPSTKLNIAAW
jgi:hypothetical protein